MLQSIMWQRVGHNLVTELQETISLLTFCYLFPLCVCVCVCVCVCMPFFILLLLSYDLMSIFSIMSGVLSLFCVAFIVDFWFIVSIMYVCAQLLSYVCLTLTPCFLCLLHWQVDSLPLASPVVNIILYSSQHILGWPKNLFVCFLLFHRMIQKSPNKRFGYHNISDYFNLLISILNPF